MKYSDEECRDMIERLQDGPLQEGPSIETEHPKHDRYIAYCISVQKAMLEAAAALEERLGPVGDSETEYLLEALMDAAATNTDVRVSGSWGKVCGTIRALLRERDELQERVKEVLLINEKLLARVKELEAFRLQALIREDTP